MVPQESSWFGYYRGTEVVPMEALDIYTSDKLGLKWMNENDKLVLLTAPQGHLHLDQPWFVQNIIPYLKM